MARSTRGWTRLGPGPSRSRGEGTSSDTGFDMGALYRLLQQCKSPAGGASFGGRFGAILPPHASRRPATRKPPLPLLSLGDRRLWTLRRRVSRACRHPVLLVAAGPVGSPGRIAGAARVPRPGPAGRTPPGCRLEAGALCGLRRSRGRSEEHTSELQSRLHLVCRLLLVKKKKRLKVTLLQ